LTTKSSALPGACAVIGWLVTPLVTGPPVPAWLAAPEEEPSPVALEFTSGDDSHAASAISLEFLVGY